MVETIVLNLVDLLVLVRHHVHCQGELIHVVLLLAAVENADFRVRDATAEPRLRVRLVLAVAVALIRTATHLDRLFTTYRDTIE